MTAAIASLYGPSRGLQVSRPEDFMDTLLDSVEEMVEKRSVVLPLSGQVELSFVRIDPGVYRTMDLLEYAIRKAEYIVECPSQRVMLLRLLLMSARLVRAEDRMLTL